MQKYNARPGMVVRFVHQVRVQGTALLGQLWVRRPFFVFSMQGAGEQLEYHMLLNPKQLFRAVRSGEVSNDTHQLVRILVNGHTSGLGVQYKGFNQGELRMSKRELEKIAKRYVIRVLLNHKEVSTNGTNTTAA